MTTSVRLKGHLAVSLEGIQYIPDSRGVFMVPDHLAPILVEQHGGERVPNLLLVDTGVDRLAAGKKK